MSVFDPLTGTALGAWCVGIKVQEWCGRLGRKPTFNFALAQSGRKVVTTSAKIKKGWAETLVDPWNYNLLSTEHQSSLRQVILQTETHVTGVNERPFNDGRE